MTILSKNNEQGRSMVEMLGVLAIIGVLSVGGISGYSKAMAKFKLTKAQDQISMLLMNIRTAFATMPTYSGLSNDTAISYNIAPTDMVPNTASSAINHAFGGPVTITATSIGAATNQYFSIKLANLGREACVSLASSDWGTDGLYYMIVNETKHSAQEIPLSFISAGDKTKNCKEKGSYNSIDWIYY